MAGKALPYENATSGNNAIADIQKMLRAFGCTKFGTGEDFETGELHVQFEHRGRMVQLTANARGYAAAWLKLHPHTTRSSRTLAEHKAHALKLGGVAVYSILRDWVKGQITAVEIGMLTFDAAFLPHLVMANGQTVIEHVHATKLLPPPQDGEQ